ncbi:MAG: metallophosphoesterase [Candidatus Woesearchaeota archaeon]
MSKEYYFISDLHIGLGEFEKVCAFENELIKFLKSLEEKTTAELIIVGDLFGFWELNKDLEKDKLIELIKVHKNLFNQFKTTGSKIKIFLVPGNHDYEVKTNKYKEILKKYNILVSEDILIKEIQNKKIWIEHGHAQDEYNRTLNSESEKPMSYYATKEIVSSIHNKNNSKNDWILDIQSVQPREDTLNWLFSNYFYKELNPVFRFIALPFLLFFMFSFFVLIGGYLKKLGIITIPILTTKFSTYFGLFGSMLDFIIFLDTLIVLVIIIAYLPFIILYKDLKKKFTKFFSFTQNFREVKIEEYINHAKKLFKENKDVKIFIFGHIHKNFISKIEEGIIINTGTWIKSLKKIKAFKLFLLPAVYYPHYKLSIVHIFEENNKIIIENKIIRKEINTHLTWLQKLAILLVPYKKKSEVTKTTLD